MIRIAPKVGSVLLAMLLATVSGCSFLLPTSESLARSKWSSYADARTAFDRIDLGRTATNELAALGFDPSANANVRVLTYVDILQRFMPNPSITKEDLEPAVRRFIENRNSGQAWEIEVIDVKSRRHGNAFLDVTGFVKKTRETGWEFKALLLLEQGVVVYKLHSGRPNIDRNEKRVRPLGPLQELDSLLFRVTTRQW